MEEIAGPLASYGEKYKDLVTMPPENCPEEPLNSEESLLLKILGYEPMFIDELDTPWPMDKLLQLLIALELKGVIVSEQGYYTRVWAWSYEFFKMRLLLLGLRNRFRLK